MNYKSLELHIAQVEQAIINLRKHFLDYTHQAAYDDLAALFIKIKSSDYKNFNQDDLIISKTALDEIFYGIEHLNYRRRREIPRETIYCLELALSDWIDDFDRYLIVTSLNNKLEEFQIRAHTKGYFDKLALNIEGLFNHQFEQSLVRIGKPKQLINNYLTSVATYHELGHFVDRYYQISENIIQNEPGLKYILSRPNQEIVQLFNHYSEFFADLFAAQYVGNSCNEYINYISFNQPDSFTHPATSTRMNVVNSFINSTALTEVDYIKKWTQIRSGGRQLSLRNTALDFNPFVEDRVIKISNPNQVHSLFLEGWNSWTDTDSFIRQKYIDPTKVSSRINRIIKHSIRTSMPKRKHKPWRYFKTNSRHYLFTILPSRSQS